MARCETGAGWEQCERQATHRTRMNEANDWVELCAECVAPYQALGWMVELLEPLR